MSNAPLCDPVDAIRDVQRRILPPPPILTLSEWANRERILGPEESSEPGQWKTSRVPYLREPMDAVSDPAVRTIVLMCSARVGKTELINNSVGYFVDQDPCPILVVQPRIEDARSWSKEKLAPMIRNTPALRNKIRDAQGQESKNEIQRKNFAGGYIYMTAGNSASGLKSRTCRVVIFDEVENIAREAGEFGDPIELAKTRTTTYPGRFKHILVSTPGNREGSAIEAAFHQGTMSRYEVPCPHCGVADFFRWPQVEWPKDPDDPDAAFYRCPHCQEKITDADKQAMLDVGQWVAQKHGNPGVVSYHLNAIYNPWISFADLVRVFLEKHAKGPAGLKTFVNEYLGETWNDKIQEEERVEGLMGRVRNSNYASEVIPRGVGLLVAGIDVQGDRLEAEVRGVGTRGTRWTIGHYVIDGNPMMDPVWDRLEGLLTQEWGTESGKPMTIRRACVDEGFNSKVVKRQVGKRGALKGILSMVKGASGRQPQWCIKSKTVRNLYSIDTVSIKDLIYTSIQIEDPEIPGYQHLPSNTPKEYLDQLLSNKRNPRTKRYDKPNGAADEVLDGWVYCEAALDLFAPRRGEVEELVAYYAGPETPKPTLREHDSESKPEPEHEPARPPRNMEDYMAQKQTPKATEPVEPEPQPRAEPPKRRPPYPVRKSPAKNPHVPFIKKKIVGW